MIKKYTIESLAKVFKIKKKEIIKILLLIGIKKKNNEKISEKEKEKIFYYLNKYNIFPKKINIQKKTYSMLNIKKNNGKKKLINIEIRKKKIFYQKNKCNSSTIDFINQKKLENNHLIKKNNFHFLKKSKVNNIKNFENKNKNFLLIKKEKIFNKKNSKKIPFIKKNINISDISNKISVKKSFLVNRLKKFGVKIKKSQKIDYKIFQSFLKKDKLVNNKFLNTNKIEKKNIFSRRIPIVAIMGHVNHGKTTLLDKIRSSNIIKNEVGGITQQINAYHIIKGNNSITFIDTPGHKIFESMRLRSTNIADIIVLVVSINDGIKPQTIESINLAKQKNIPIIVAFNKIDISTSNKNVIINDLLKLGICSDKLGGENQFVYISAKLGYGINDLLEAILLQADMLELKTLKNSCGEGIVLESFIDKGKGPIVIVLTKNGRFSKRDYIVCDNKYGKIKSIRNEFGKEISFVDSSIPVEISGLSGMPEIGKKILSLDLNKKIRKKFLYKKKKYKKKLFTYQENLYNKNNIFNILEKKIFYFKIILKSDKKGSSEVILYECNKFFDKNYKIQIIKNDIGEINLADIKLAILTNSIVFGFNVKINILAKKLAKKNNVNIFNYNIIYDLLNKIKTTINSKYQKEKKFITSGIACIKNIFINSKKNKIAGCLVISGKILLKNKIFLVRQKKTIFYGKLNSIKRFENNVHEVKSGIECGILIKNYDNPKIGDYIKSIQEVKESKIKNKE